MPEFMTSMDRQVQRADAHLADQRSNLKKAPSERDGEDAFSKELFKNREDYIKLFLTQMRYQTPDKPMDPADMMAALGQMASVEASRGVREATQHLLELQKQAQMISMAGHKGSFMEVDAQDFYHAPWDAPRLIYELPEGIEKTSVTIFNEKGERVADLEGPTKAGRNEVIWDGKGFKGEVLPEGKYRFNVQMFGEGGKAPVDEEGNIVTARHRSMMRVTGVKMVKGSPTATSYDMDVPMSSVTGLSAEGAIDLEKKDSKEKPGLDKDGLVEDSETVVKEVLDEILDKLDF